MMAALIPAAAAAIPAIAGMFRKGDSSSSSAQHAPAPAAPQSPSPAQLMEIAGRSAPQHDPENHPLTTPRATALDTLSRQQSQREQQHHQASVARAQVRRTADAINPQLAEIQQSLRHRQNQIQATAEHRTIQERESFRAEMRRRLAGVQTELDQVLRLQRQGRRY